MKNIILIVILAAIGWYGWGKYEDQARARRAAELAGKPAKQALPQAKGDAGVSFFTCDGRSQCKQMKSCEEAKYFAQNCPGFQAGVSGEETSCVQQWCRK